MKKRITRKKTDKFQADDPLLNWLFGLGPGPRKRYSRDDIKDLWNRLGAEWQRLHPEKESCWALREFGEPGKIDK